MLSASKKHSYLCKQSALGFKIETHAMPLVIQEIFQPQKLHCTQRSPVTPINWDF